MTPKPPIPYQTAQPNRLRFLSLLGLLALLVVGCVAFRAFGATSPRVVYGLAHLPVALIAIAAAGAVLLIFYPTPPTPEEQNGRRPLVAVAVIFCALWIPAWLAGGWVQDDWRLLAAASIRKVVELHPAVSFAMLDSVDGNYRPLSTVLYFSWMLRWFGAAAHAFTAGPLLMTLLSGVVLYLIVRELGYSQTTAATASVLFLTRGMLYTVATWASALGDGIAICLCGVTALLVLRACRSGPAAAVLLNLGALLSLTFATLAKQSSFVTPLIVALILLLRPGRCLPSPTTRRLWTAAVALVVYTAPVVAVFLHARSLNTSPSPYPIGISLASVWRPFSYLTWYFAVLQLPNRLGGTALVSGAAGVAIACLCLYLLKRFPQLMGERPRDIRFAILAAASSLSILMMLQTRAAPYYGCMFAFWLSIAIAVPLTCCWSADPSRTGGVCWAVLLCLLLSGFAEVRLEQIGLIASGGYTWGTFSSYADKQFDRYVQQRLAESPQARTALLQNCRDHGTPSAMVLLGSPRIQHILLYDDGLQTYFVNDRHGERPSDDVSGRTDTGAYNWSVPVDSAAAQALLADQDVVRIPCVDGFFAPAGPER